jgi:DNA-binding CsgD family transcriptional regulator/tetratricopeptide (TPR) repeat protein
MRDGDGGAVELRGRRRECEVLDRLLAAVRAGQGQVLVLRGEAGVGKTALLDHLQARATGFRVVRAAGVESEGELAFAGLHQLCGPLLGDVAGLPDRQRAALGTVFGLDRGEPPDRFIVGLALLGLLSAVAEEGPVVCMIDDVQWLDRASLQTVAFVARRLLAESVALVFALREVGDEQELAGLPELLVGGLGEEDAGALLDSVTPGRLDERVRDRILSETRGNPLALLELPRGLSGADLAGGFGRLDERPLASRIEQSYLRRIDALPPATRTLLLLAAAEPVGDVILLWDAAERLGVGPEAVAPAESAGLIEVGTRVRFRHPLARTAAYRSADVTDRRRAHGALAEATDPEVDPDRRAWHRAHAAVGPDEDVAGELERSAARAQGRGGVAAAAAFLERATELTPDPARRGARALVAAEAKLGAASPDGASALIATADLCPLDELDRVRLVRLRAQVAFARRRGNDAVPMLFDAAQRLEPLDATRARETYLDALGAAIYAGRLSTPGLPEMARAARSAPPGPRPTRAVDLLLDGVAVRYDEGYITGVAALRQALQAMREDHDEIRYLGLASRFASELWEDEACDELAARHVRLARSTGTLGALPLALAYRSTVDLHAGEFATAAALIDEVETLTASTGEAPVTYCKALLAAWRGDGERLSAVLDRALPGLIERGEGRGLSGRGYLLALLGNGQGDYDAALEAAQTACEHDDLDIVAWALVELVEAAARCGRPEAAATALERLCERTSACATDWALGMEARSRALLRDGPEAEDLYREAVERLARTRVTVHHARAHLVYGEWLRREGRRVDARQQLRSAHDMLGRFGAAGFAQRARRELQATGETVRKRQLRVEEVLTPQEAQVARLASEGHTNPEIGSQLYISPRTAEYHLSKVFTKLSISSRRQLRSALAQRERSATLT